MGPDAQPWLIALLSGLPVALSAAFAYLSSIRKSRHQKEIEEAKSEHQLKATEIEANLKFRDQLLARIDQAEAKISELEKLTAKQRKEIDDLDEAEEECRRREQQLRDELATANARITRLEDDRRSGGGDHSYKKTG